MAADPPRALGVEEVDDMEENGAENFLLLNARAQAQVKKGKNWSEERVEELAQLIFAQLMESQRQIFAQAQALVAQMQRDSELAARMEQMNGGDAPNRPNRTALMGKFAPFTGEDPKQRHTPQRGPHAWPPGLRHAHLPSLLLDTQFKDTMCG